jgi:hypothetical protein
VGVVQVELVSQVAALVLVTLAAVVGSVQLRALFRNWVEVRDTFQPASLPVASITSRLLVVLAVWSDPLSCTGGNPTSEMEFQCRVPAVRVSEAGTQATTEVLSAVLLVAGQWVPVGP